MCKQIGAEPKEDEIPIEFLDLPYELQELMEIHSLLPQEWDTNSGYYLGKNYTLLPYLFKLYNIDDEKESLTIILKYDNVIQEDLNKQQQNKIKRASKKNG